MKIYMYIILSHDSFKVQSRLGTPKPITPITKLPKRFVPTYRGDQNAFSIQLFCIDERYEMR